MHLRGPSRQLEAQGSSLEASASTFEAPAGNFEAQAGQSSENSAHGTKIKPPGGAPGAGPVVYPRRAGAMGKRTFPGQGAGLGFSLSDPRVPRDRGHVGDGAADWI